LKTQAYEDLKLALERALNKTVKLKQGKRADRYYGRGWRRSGGGIDG
jgi:hypothetical protein